MQNITEIALRARVAFSPVKAGYSRLPKCIDSRGRARVCEKCGCKMGFVGAHKAATRCIATVSFPAASLSDAGGSGEVAVHARRALIESAGFSVGLQLHHHPYHWLVD